MKIRIATQPIHAVKAQALVLLNAGDEFEPKLENKSLTKHFETYKAAVSSGKTTGEWFCTMEIDAGVATDHVLMDSESFGGWMPGKEKLKSTVARCVATCRKDSLGKIAFACHGESAPLLAQCIVEGAGIGDFIDNRFKSVRSVRKPLEITLVTSKDQRAKVKRAAEEASTVIQSINWARELVNAPSNLLYPAKLAAQAQAMAKNYESLKVEVWDEKKIAKEKCGLLQAVGQGDVHSPRMIVLRHTPKTKKSKEKIVLVGKGMCFDTGGYSLKNATGIVSMNGDMAGAAGVLGAMKAIAELNLPLQVIAYIPSAVNSVDANAYKPGNIITSKSGKTVWIDNTDAEGRLIMADALTCSAKDKPSIVIDMATLTGAAIRALGPQCAALFCNDAKLRDLFQESSDATGDTLWPLPINREYANVVSHPLADLMNSNMAAGAAGGGAIHAALFLKEFVPDNVRWVHLDMSAAARAKSPTRYYQPGATGWGVRLLVDTLKRIVETK